MDCKFEFCFSLLVKFISQPEMALAMGQCEP